MPQTDQQQDRERHLTEEERSNLQAMHEYGMECVPPDVIDAIVDRLCRQLSEQEEVGITAEAQDRIRDQLVRLTGCDHIDGAACDSGDPVDFTLAEIGQAITYLLDKLDEQQARAEAYKKASSIAREWGDEILHKDKAIDHLRRSALHALAGELDRLAREAEQKGQSDGQ